MRLVCLVRLLVGGTAGSTLLDAVEKAFCGEACISKELREPWQAGFDGNEALYPVLHQSTSIYFPGPLNQSRLHFSVQSPEP